FIAISPPFAFPLSSRDNRLRLNSFPTRRSSDLRALLPSPLDAMRKAATSRGALIDRLLPFLSTIRGYRAEYFRLDFVAGLTTARSEEHTSELQSRENLVCRLLLERNKLSLIRIT